MRFSPLLIVLLLAALLAPGLARCAEPEPPVPTDPKAIRDELRGLRKRTADRDPKVRARIELLMKQLQRLQAQRDAGESQARGEEKPYEENDPAVMTRETTWEKMREIASQGKGAKFDLAEPVRTKIKEEYEEDQDKSIKNPSLYQAMTVLTIDLSSKEADALIELLDKFTGIETLIVTGGSFGAPVNLPYILDKAKKLPLSELYIFNFRNFLPSLPESIGQFKGLTTLSLFNNSLSSLPLAVGEMKQLRVLHVDMNPISTLLPTVKGLPFLTELGVGKTGITAAEQQQIARLLPNCTIVTK